ncbi:hypothetical protein OG599_01500 [Streptomyces sp. NBC_01335]|uniref:hypothetical protein n=1 Tax=Streptomyces sp. NBC_01335 TaxID=2903828 RepID=UPI002E1020F8|nr:hypothetical protein OG599_01500 [Streptomyces sp. NBC_01335]
MPTPSRPRPRARIRHVTVAGSALAGALLPLVAGVLLAKVAAGDPMSSVNALITRTGPGSPVPPSQWRGCGRAVLRRSGEGRSVSGAARGVRGVRAGRG